MSFKKRSFDLTGKVAVVIGGSSGIGKGIALTLADHGADVVPASRNIERAKKAVAEIEELGRKSILTSVDITKEEQIIELKRQMLKEFGKIDILVNSQGVQIPAYIHELTLEDWRTVLSVNCDSVFSATRIFGEQMMKQKSGKIINIASMASFVGLVYASPYTASKGAVNQFTKAAALEFAPYNIQVNAIAPGWFKTDLTQPIYEGQPERYEEIRSRIPAGEWGEVEDLGACAVYLASDAANYVTGITIPVDGGILYNGG